MLTCYKEKLFSLQNQEQKKRLLKANDLILLQHLMKYHITLLFFKKTYFKKFIHFFKNHAEVKKCESQGAN